MKLLDFIYKLNYEASRIPNMGRICGGDIYELNHYQDIKYPAFCATQGQHSEAGDWRYYQFNLFYVDRLTSTHGNSQEIQSEAIDALSRIIRNITSYGIETEGTVTYDVFTERFDSECAGAYATVTFGTMVDDICPEWYENPVYTIRYTMESGYTLKDEDFSFGGDYGFLWHDAEDHEIVFINRGGSNASGSFRTEENKHIATMDFSKANAPGFYLEGVNYQGGTLKEVILPDTLVHLGILQGSIFTGLTIPVTCERIEMTFTSCDYIQTITYEGTVDQFNAISKFDQSSQGSYFTWSGGTEMLQYVDCTDGIICLRWCGGCTSDCETDCPYEQICTEDYPCENDCPTDYCEDCPSHCDDSPCSDCASDCASDCSSDCSEDGCVSDTPCSDCASDCPSDGVCTSDNPCASDCASDCPTDGQCTSDGTCTSDCPTDGVCTEDGCTSDGCASDNPCPSDTPCTDCSEDGCASDCPSDGVCTDVCSNDCASDCSSDCASDCSSDCSSYCSADAPTPVPTTPLVDGERYIIYGGGYALSTFGSSLVPVTSATISGDTIIISDYEYDTVNWINVCILTAVTSGDSCYLEWTSERPTDSGHTYQLISQDVNIYGTSARTGTRFITAEENATSPEIIEADSNLHPIAVNRTYNGEEMRLYGEYSSVYGAFRALFEAPSVVNGDPEWQDWSLGIYKYYGDLQNK